MLCILCINCNKHGGEGDSFDNTQYELNSSFASYSETLLN